MTLGRFVPLAYMTTGNWLLFLISFVRMGVWVWLVRFWAWALTTDSWQRIDLRLL